MPPAPLELALPPGSGCVSSWEGDLGGKASGGRVIVYSATGLALPASQTQLPAWSVRVMLATGQVLDADLSQMAGQLGVYAPEFWA